MLMGKNKMFLTDLLKIYAGYHCFLNIVIGKFANSKRLQRLPRNQGMSPCLRGNTFMKKEFQMLPPVLIAFIADRPIMYYINYLKPGIGGRLSRH
jgi:hypothetical protein